MRSRTLPATLSTPSCVCRNEIELPRFVETAPWRRAAADSFIATARPPASSAGLTIFEPLESRFRLFCNISFEAARLFAATVAAKFVLMTTDMVIFLDPERGVRATFVSGRAAPDRAGLDFCLNGAAIV